MAVLYAKDQLGLNQDFYHEEFWALYLQAPDRRDTGWSIQSCRPTISGTAWITAISQFVV